MPSKSKAQQKFMGMVHALQKGDMKPSDASPAVKRAAQSMKKKDAKDFASTSHKGLPRKVKQEILNRLKEYANKMGRDHLGGDDYTSSKKGGLRDFDGYDNVDYNNNMPMDESSKKELIKDLDKAKNDLLKKVKVLVDKKKKLYSNMDIESPMSPEEKKLNKDIADIFSQINKLVLQKRNIKEGKLPNNWMSGRTSDYHTKLRGKEREYDDTNFEKDNSGQPDLEEAFDKVEHLKLLNLALRTMPGSQKQKEVIRKLNKVRKAGGMRPLKETTLSEYASKQTLSYLPADDEEIKKMNETMVRRAVDLAQQLLPKDTFSRYASDGKKNAEFVKNIVRDLARSLNQFYKNHNINVRIHK